MSLAFNPRHFLFAAIGTLLAANTVGRPRLLRHVQHETEASTLGTLVEITAMRAARMAHTATALPNGRVLIAGGFTDDANASKSAELFDPETERYLALPPMKTPRHSHSATMLPNGKVLIVGGYGAGNSVLTTAELFDPVTSTFSSTGSLHAPHAGHIAVLLDNGKVLIAGGIGPDWTFLSSAELYDPATGAFTPTGAMTVARESHVAVKLDDGRVLIAGGHRDRRPNIIIYTSAETFDATTGTFTRVGDMRVRRHKHDGVLLKDGRVLITGGSDERDDRGQYISTEFFNARSNQFTLGPELKSSRYKHYGTAVLLPNGNVLLAGGAPRAETFEPRTNSFSTVGGDAQMAGQFSAAALLKGGRVLISGGYGNGTGPRASTWMYRP